MASTLTLVAPFQQMLLVQRALTVCKASDGARFS